MELDGIEVMFHLALESIFQIYNTSNVLATFWELWCASQCDVPGVSLEMGTCCSHLGST